MAYAFDVIVVPSENALSVANHISSKLDNSIIVRSTDDPRIEIASSIITIGDRAFIELPDHHENPVIASFISYNAFYSASPQKRQNAKAIFIEPNPEDLARKIVEVFGRSPDIGYIFGNKDYYFESLRLQKEINVVGVRYDDSALRSLNKLYRNKSIDGFYVSENRSVFNTSNILLVLESLYRNRLPAISSNSSLKGRGAVLTVYTQYNDIQELTIRMVQSKDIVTEFPTDNFPKSEFWLDRRLAKKISLHLEGIK